MWLAQDQNLQYDLPASVTLCDHEARALINRRLRQLCSFQFTIANFPLPSPSSPLLLLCLSTRHR